MSNRAREAGNIAAGSGEGRVRPAGWLVVVAALLMGLPTLRGRFVGGDDHRLVLDHVLVSRPSWSHAVQLLGMVHRDLYQPLPLLSFSAEFAVLRALGLQADLTGPGGGAWLFHLTNVLLHGLNAWLVWRLIRRLHPDWRVAACAGVLFAIHPLQVEVVAWVNGRMMLMSTLFVLLTLQAWLRFLDLGEPRGSRADGRSELRASARAGGRSEPRASARADDLSEPRASARAESRPSHGLPSSTGQSWVLGLIVLLCVTAAMMSKVRVSMPVLMLVVAVASRNARGAWRRYAGRNAARAEAGGSLGSSARAEARGSLASQDGDRCPAGWRRPSVIVLWTLAALITAGFTWLNVVATVDSDMFLQGAQKLQGPRVARAIIALAWYLSHVVWPVGLSAWYEPIAVVSWADARTVASLAIVLLVVAAVAASVRGTRVGLYGFGWFLASIASTLPLIPSRNLLAADRYTYLPIIGLLWIAAAVGVSLMRRQAGVEAAAPSDEGQPGTPAGRRVGPAARWLTWGGATVVFAALLATSWKTSGYYLDSVAKMARNLDIHPDSPNMHAKLGWACLQSGDARRGLELGREELRLHADETADEAWQLIGLSLLQLGEAEAAIDALERAVAAAPDNKQAHYRLASALADAGRDQEALAAFRRIIPQLPNFNPGLFKAAGLYRRMGLRDDARGLYEQMLTNNEYDIYAPVALAEMDVEDARYEAAADRLAALLAWYPEHAAAATNLGVCHTRLDRPDEALAAYRHAVEVDPRAVQAWLNMALLLAAEDRTAEAERTFLHACDVSGGQWDVLLATHHFYLNADRPDRAVDLWRAWTTGGGGDVRGRIWLGWALTLHGGLSEAAATLQSAAVMLQSAAAMPQSTAAKLGGSPPHPQGGSSAESNGSLPHLEAGPLLLAARALLAAAAPSPSELLAPLDALIAEQSAGATVAKSELLDALTWYGERHPQEPWPYLAAGILLSDAGRREEAMAGFEAFQTLCDDPGWRKIAQERMRRGAAGAGGR